MRTAILLLIALGVPSTAGAADKYQSKDGRYAVAFPAKVEVKLEEKVGDGSPMKTATVELDGRSHSVTYFRVPEELTEAEAKEVLEGMETAVVQADAGKLVSAKAIAFGPRKLPGRDIIADKGGNKVRFRLIISGTRFYMIVLDGPRDFAIEKDGAAFLDSFEVLEAKYESKDGKFSVAFPEDAKVICDKLPPVGGMTTHFARVEIKEKNYMVGYVDMPANVKDNPARELLDSMEKRVVQRGYGKLVSSKDIVFGKEKLPGRELVSDKDGHKIRCRIIISGARVYTIVVSGLQNYAVEKAGTDFLDSFELAK